VFQATRDSADYEKRGTRVIEPVGGRRLSILSVPAIFVLSVLATAACDDQARAQLQDQVSAKKPDYAAVQREVRAAVQASLDKGGTSVSYAVMMDGEVVVADAVGYLDSSRKQAATADTLYNIGSVSKVITAAAVMKLVDDRLVELDRPVVRYLPDFKMKDPRYSDITVRMLLNHTSAMLGTDYSAGVSYGSYDDGFYGKTARYFGNSILKAAPGAYAVYCNDGFEVAEMLVARVSGQPYDDFVHDHLFVPLGMWTSGYATRRFAEGSFAVKGTLPHEFPNAMGSGGANTTLADLARFGDEFLRTTPRVLSQASMKELARVQGVTIVPDDTVGSAYGLGWDVVGKQFADVDFGSDVLDKAGGTTQFSAQLYVIPRHGIAAAISVTDDFSGEAAGTLRDIVARVLRSKGIETAKTKVATTPVAAKPLPAGFEQEFNGYYASNGSLLKVAAQSDATVTIFRYDGQAFTPVEQKLGYDGQDFRRPTGEKAYRFVRASGRRYVMGVSEGQGMVNAMAERIESRATPLGAWEKRLGRLYLPAEVSANAVYVLAGITVVRQPDLDGLVFAQTGGTMTIMGVTDDNNTTTVLQIPGLNGRDLTTLTAETVDGEEWLATPAYRMRPAATLSTLSAGTWTIPSSGANLLLKLPGAKVGFSLPSQGRVMAYDTDGAKAYDSTAQGADAGLLPTAGYIRFVGPAGARFTVTLVK
jgi:CubicO group peptidase (beta-lactamase class C family)